jgi:2-polyprenyl-3-methyl-5-hydroxy-6-metoxy-1,4-benzoquinol methylase
MIKKKCPICENNSTNIIYNRNLPKTIDESNYAGRKPPDYYHYEMVRCTKCKILYANSIYDEVTIEKLYNDSDFTYSEEIPGLKLTYEYCLKKAQNFLAHKNSFLDIGCGNGFMLEVANNNGWENVVGIEPSLNAIKEANPKFKKMIINKVFNSSSLKKESFDLVFCAMILEHVSDINKFLDQIKWILKPGGIILAITHNEKHFLSRILKNKHPIINDEHAYVFSPNSLKKIFQKHNYKIKEISNLKNIYTIKYWLKMIPGFKRFKTYLIWILENTKIFKSMVGLKAGNIFIIAQKPKR